MKSPSEWTWVHYKILGASLDCSNLPERTQDHGFFGFPGGSTRGSRRRAGRRRRRALLDLIEAEALDVFDENGRPTREQAITVVRDDSSWSYEGRGGQVEVVENEKTAELARDGPDEKNPHVSLNRNA